MAGWRRISTAGFRNDDLVIRDLGFSGDEIDLRLRSAGFGSPDEHLAKQKADVIFAFFGYNESFAGADRPREVQALAGRLHQALAGSEIQRAKRPAARVVFADRS